jgi:hypothetical protein
MRNFNKILIDTRKKESLSEFSINPLYAPFEFTINPIVRRVLSHLACALIKEPDADDVFGLNFSLSKRRKYQSETD